MTVAYHFSKWRKGGVPVYTGPVYDPDAQAHFSRLTTQDEAFLNALNDLIVGLKADGVWSRLQAIAVWHPRGDEMLLNLKGATAGDFDYRSTIDQSLTTPVYTSQKGLEVGKETETHIQWQSHIIGPAACMGAYTSDILVNSIKQLFFSPLLLTRYILISTNGGLNVWEVRIQGDEGSTIIQDLTPQGDFNTQTDYNSWVRQNEDPYNYFYYDSPNQRTGIVTNASNSGLKMGLSINNPHQGAGEWTPLKIQWQRDPNAQLQGVFMQPSVTDTSDADSRDLGSTYPSLGGIAGKPGFFAGWREASGALPGGWFDSFHVYEMSESMTFIIGWSEYADPSMIASKTTSVSFPFKRFWQTYINLGLSPGAEACFDGIFVIPQNWGYKSMNFDGVTIVFGAYNTYTEVDNNNNIHNETFSPRQFLLAYWVTDQKLTQSETLALKSRLETFFAAVGV